MNKLIGVLVAVLVLGACEGPMGPEGPRGPQGATGPQGPAGPGANFWYSQGFANANGAYSVQFSGQQVDGILVQCWTRQVSGSWIQVATAADGGAPNGVVGCAKTQSGSAVVVTALTYAFWEVLVVAVAMN